MNSSEILVADGQIEQFSYQGSRLIVLVRTDAGAFEITFHTVLGVTALSPENVDLSHLAESMESQFLFDVCEAAEEPADGFKEFSFISAWDEKPILKVIAIDVSAPRILHR